MKKLILVGLLLLGTFSNIGASASEHLSLADLIEGTSSPVAFCEEARMNSPVQNSTGTILNGTIHSGTAVIRHSFANGRTRIVAHLGSGVITGWVPNNAITVTTC